MYDTNDIYLVAMAGVAVFGLQGSLGLAVRHGILQRKVNNTRRSKCDRVIQSKHAYIANIPIAYGAVFFYTIVLFELGYIWIKQSLDMFWLNTTISLSVVVTLYYAYILFFNIKILCSGCIRMYIANFMMVVLLLSYYIQ